MSEAKQSSGKLRTNELEMNEQEMSEAEVLFEMNRKLPRMQILSEAGVGIFERGTDYGDVK